MYHAQTQEIKIRPPIHLAFEQFESGNLPFDLPSTPGFGEGGLNRWELSLQTDAAKRRISSKGHPLALSSQGSSALLLRVSRSGEQSPGRAQRGTKGMGKDQTVSADKPHPLHSVPLACATTAISRGLGVRVAGAPRRVEAATEEKEAVGVIPAGRGQLRYARPHTFVAARKALLL